MIPWTLGVMAKAPVVGSCKTRLARVWGEVRACALYEAMLLDTLDALLRVPVARHVVMAAPEADGVAHLARLAGPRWDVVPQRGPDLGVRLGAAFCDLGTPSCLVSSDSPTIDAGAIGAALEGLRAPRQIVCGPCEDGGYYLVGMTSPALEVLDDIPWSTSGVMEATRARCRAHGLPLHELPIGYDVDEAADAERLARELREAPERAPRTAALLTRG